MVDLSLGRHFRRGTSCVRRRPPDLCVFLPPTETCTATPSWFHYLDPNVYPGSAPESVTDSTRTKWVYWSYRTRGPHPLPSLLIHPLFRQDRYRRRPYEGKVSHSDTFRPTGTSPTRGPRPVSVPVLGSRVGEGVGDPITPSSPVGPRFSLHPSEDPLHLVLVLSRRESVR